MKIAAVNGVELECEVVGSGEPVLLISPVLADGFRPLLAEPALADHYQLIHYHRRGWVGSTHTPPPGERQRPRRRRAALSTTSASPAPTSPGTPPARPWRCRSPSTIPGNVRSLLLLELSLFSVPSGQDLPGAGRPCLRGVRQR